MPLKIRLQRKGKRDQPLYRLVVCDQHTKSNGKTVKILGSADLDCKPPKVDFDKNEFNKWIKNGAQVSPSVRKLLSI